MIRPVQQLLRLARSCVAGRPHDEARQEGERQRRVVREMRQRAFELRRRSVQLAERLHQGRDGC